MFNKLEAIDIIAIVFIVGCIVLKALGKDSWVDYILIGVSSYYFGKKSSGVIEIKKSND